MDTLKPLPEFSPQNNDWNDQIVRVYIDGMGYFQGIAIEVTSTTMVVDFPVSHAPALFANQEIPLAFSSERQTSSLKFTAKVVYRGEDEYRCRLRFEISPDIRIALTTVIEARGEYRIASEANPPIHLRLSNDSKRNYVDSTLENYSSLGMSVLVSADAENTLDSQKPLRMEFALPGDADPYVLLGTIRYTGPIGGRTRHGIEVEPNSDPLIHASLERYQRFVRQQQGRVLRQLAAAKGLDRRTG